MSIEEAPIEVDIQTPAVPYKSDPYIQVTSLNNEVTKNHSAPDLRLLSPTQPKNEDLITRIKNYFIDLASHDHGKIQICGMVTEIFHFAYVITLLCIFKSFSNAALITLIFDMLVGIFFHVFSMIIMVYDDDTLFGLMTGMNLVSIYLTFNNFIRFIDLNDQTVAAFFAALMIIANCVFVGSISMLHYGSKSKSNQNN